MFDTRRIEDTTPVPSRPMTILLAEDNVVNQRVAAGILEKRGHTVVVANNGKEATQAIATQRFDLVLMDVQMPEMDGLDGHRRDSPTGRSNGQAHPDRCDDGSCHERRPRALPGSGNGRLSVQASQSQGTVGDHRTSGETLGRRSIAIKRSASTQPASPAASGQQCLCSQRVDAVPRGTTRSAGAASTWRPY